MRRLTRYLPHCLGAISVTLLVFAGIHGYAGWRAKREGRTRQRDLAVLEAQVRQLRSAAAQPEIELTGTGTEARWVLPERAERLSIVQALEQAAAQNEVEITGMGLPDRASSDRVGAKVVAQGTPRALIEFLRAIESLREILVVASARMHVDPDGRVWLDTTIISHGRALPGEAAARPPGLGEPDHG